jgi:NitT/TauT family transport system permease protein
MKLIDVYNEQPNTSNFKLEVFGSLIILAVWYAITASGLVPKAILPTPLDVLYSFKELHFNNYLIVNTGYSLWINILGYVEAIIVSLFFGFIIGIVPPVRKIFSRYVDALRFIPLTAVLGLFIAWFGIDTNMKVQFLAFGIFVYLLPVIVNRIDEIDEVYKQTAYTLGASKWQCIRYVYFPYVISKVFDDIRVLTAISWTYVIIAEVVNKTDGIGALINTCARQSRTDKVFALLIVIVLIGVIQDKLLKGLGNKLFPYKKIQQ